MKVEPVQPINKIERRFPKRTPIKVIKNSDTKGKKVDILA